MKYAEQTIIRNDRKVGVNYLPLHPNYRSKTRGYLGKEAEKQLKRRARNPLTGKSELIDNISYKDWLKQHDIVKTTAPVDIFVYSDKI